MNIILLSVKMAEGIKSKQRNSMKPFIYRVRMLELSLKKWLYNTKCKHIRDSKLSEIAKYKALELREK